MKKTLIILLSTFFSLNLYAQTLAPAGYSWHGPFTIKDASRYINGIHSVTINVNEVVSLDCNTNNTTKSFTNSKDNYLNVDGIFSGALAAQAQNKKVMLMLGSHCYPGKGVNLWGIEVLSE